MKQAVKVYDNGGVSVDRYTAVFQYPIDGEYQYIAMDERPFHPQGFGQHGSARQRPGAKECGRLIPRNSLPEDCRKFIEEDLAAYCALEAR